MRLNQLNESLERVFLNESWTEYEFEDQDGYEEYEEYRDDCTFNIELPKDVEIYLEEYEIPGCAYGKLPNGIIFWETEDDNIFYDDINEFISDIRYNIKEEAEIILPNIDSYDPTPQYKEVLEKAINESLEKGKVMDKLEELGETNFYESYSLTEDYEDGAMFQAYITNLGKYNEGDLVGEWCAFPIDEDDFEALLERIGIDGNEYEEWFVTDYECQLKGFNWQDLGEYPSYDDLQEFGETLENIDDIEKFDNVYEAFGDFDSAINSYDDAWFMPGVSNESELGQYYVDDVYGGAVMLSDDTIESYFDYEQLGRELNFDNYADMYDEDELAQMYENGDIENDDYVSAGEYLGLGSNASDYDIGVEFASQVGLDGVADKDYYFDYEAFGRDLSFDGAFTSDGFVFTN